MTVRAGTVLDGRHEATAPLGRGAMAVAWRGRHVGLLRDVAIKVIRGPGAGEDEYARLVREAQAGASLEHPGITTVHDVGRHEGDLFIVTELLKGSDLPAGQPPFSPELGYAGLRYHHPQVLPEPLLGGRPVPAPLSGLVLRMLAKDPADRPESALAAHAELTRLGPAPDLAAREAARGRHAAPAQGRHASAEPANSRDAPSEDDLFSRAAVTLSQMPPDEAARLLEKVVPFNAAAALCAMENRGYQSRPILAVMDPGKAAIMLSAIDPQAAVRLLGALVGDPRHHEQCRLIEDAMEPEVFKALRRAVGAEW